MSSWKRECGTDWNIRGQALQGLAPNLLPVTQDGVWFKSKMRVKSFVFL